jgi:aminoglycoside phosphotransferase (APT) family kinase protein
VWRNVTIVNMPAAEVAIDVSLVRALLREQHADLASLELVDEGSGWDNALFRLGDDLGVRLPRRGAAAALIEQEQRWLPELGPRLPLPTPVPLRIGRPGCGFPWAWSIVPWLAGHNAVRATLGDAALAAVQLGAFLSELHRPVPSDAPRNPVRGVPLSHRSEVVHNRVRQLDGLVDSAAVLTSWDDAVRTPTWSGPPLWIHGDLHPANLLVSDGRISAVIDFGDLTAGDPATDLSVAWMLLPPPARTIFRASARGSGDAIDEDTWRRARGWALALGLAYLAHSRDNDVMGTLGRATIDAVLREAL